MSQMETNFIWGLISKWNKEPLSAEEVEDCLAQANDAIEGQGIKALRITGAWDSYYADVIALYVNLDNPYAKTVIYSVDDDQFFAMELSQFVASLD